MNISKNLLFLFFGLFVANSLSAVEKEIQPKLEHATIYYQGAELTFNSSVALSKGENEIKIKGLSPNIDQNSIRITTSKFAVVNAFEFTVDYLNNSSENKNLKIWKDSLAICNNTIAELDDNIKNNENVLKLLKVNTSTNNEGNINFVELMKYAEFYKTKGIEQMKELRSFNKRKADLIEISKRLQNQISTESYRVNKQQGVLTVKINSSVANLSDLKVVYYTPNASWSPYYDIIVKNTNEPLQIKFKATVSQNTGLDWNKIPLTLTTTMPGFGKTAPLLNTWFLGFRPQRALRSTRYMMDESMAKLSETASFSVMGVSAPEPVDIKMDDFITQQNNDISQTFGIDLPYSLTGNGKAQYIELITKDVTANYMYSAIPKLSEEAYLMAEIPNWENIGLMSGNANITFDDTFMGTTYINAQSTEENLALTLGVDTRVNVKREKLQDYSSKKFLGNNVVQVFSYKITIRNSQNQNVKIIVKDQYPISSNKEISVNLLKETTTPTNNNKETGILTWDLDLASGETKTLINSFSVEYPKDQAISF